MDADERYWNEWEIEEAARIAKSKELQSDGHTKHCSYRQVWGDGICTCNKGVSHEKAG